MCVIREGVALGIVVVGKIEDGRNLIADVVW